LIYSKNFSRKRKYNPSSGHRRAEINPRSRMFPIFGIIVRKAVATRHGPAKGPHSMVF
jgi:hypothetical protein